MRFLAFLLTFACGPKSPAATTPAAAGDVAAVAGEVTTALPMWEGFENYKKPPRIVVMPTMNRTKFDVDTVHATTKLVNGLVKVSGEQFHVIDPETWAARGPQKPESGLLMLHSEVQATPVDPGDGTSAVQVLVSYRLVESDSAKAVWAQDFQWVKAKGKEGYAIWEPAPEPSPDEAAGDDAAMAGDAMMDDAPDAAPMEGETMASDAETDDAPGADAQTDAQTDAQISDADAPSAGTDPSDSEEAAPVADAADDAE